MLSTLRVPAILLVGSLVLAGCANMEGFGGGSDMTTASVAPPQPKIDPACITLTAQIDNLRREGVADKIEKAATKKYKMTHADLTKADQLTKANADFQLRCSTIMPSPITAEPAPPAPAPKAKASPKAASATAPKPPQN
jgi:predicted small secreted protein